MEKLALEQNRVLYVSETHNFWSSKGLKSLQMGLMVKKHLIAPDTGCCHCGGKEHLLSSAAQASDRAISLEVFHEIACRKIRIKSFIKQNERGSDYQDEDIPGRAEKPRSLF